MGGMKGITIKLPEAVAQRLRQQARQGGRSVAALIRERLEVRFASRSMRLVVTLLGASPSVDRQRRTPRKRFKRP
jgi:hypothetical protein